MTSVSDSISGINVICTGKCQLTVLIDSVSIKLHVILLFHVARLVM